MGIRREQAEQTQNMIVDAAAAEFARHGYSGVSFQMISNRTGVSRGGVAHHFENKEVLARRILESESGRWDDLFPAATSEGARGLTALAACAHLIAVTLQSNVRASAALRIIEELQDAPNAFDRWDEAFRLALQQAIADREVPDSIPLAEISATLVECVYGVCIVPDVARHDPNPTSRLERALGVLLPGLEHS